MVNPNRWSWSGGPRKVQAREGVVTNQQPLVRSPDEPESYKVDKPSDEKLQPGPTSVSSRRLSMNRWSWRPGATIPVTIENHQHEQGEMQGRNRNQGQADKPAKDSHRLSKHIETAKPAPTTIPSPHPVRSRPRPSSMIAPASASYGAAPSYTTFKSRIQQPAPQQEDEDQPSAGVKNVFNRVINRRRSLYHISKKSAPVQHQHQQAQAEPTPPPSRQQEQPPEPMPMQPSMRHRPQLHNPQNTLRATSTPVNDVQNQGRHTGNGLILAPLPGLDENSQLLLPPTTWRPSTAPSATGAALAYGFGHGTSSSSIAAPPATEEPGLFGRLIRRRPAAKERDPESHKKKGDPTITGNSTNQPSGAKDQVRSLTGPVPAINEATEHRQMQAQPSPLNQSSHGTYDASSSTPKSEAVSDARILSRSSVPRFLRQVTKPRQESAAMTQSAGAAILHKSKSHSHLRTSQQPASSSTAQSKLRSKRSFGKRFWSRPGANDFDEDVNHVAKTEVPALPSVPRTVYVPKHAAADFSRTTIKPPRLNRHSLVVADDQVDVPWPLATTTADAQVGEPETRQRQRTPAAEKVGKGMPRDLSSSKYEAPSPLELHRRLEIIKSSEIEVVATREPLVNELWQHHFDLLRANSNTSSSNTKAPVPRGQSRQTASRRHSFSLISDPHARELTPPRSASPVEMEAPADPPSRTPQQMPFSTPPRPASSHAHTLSRQDTPDKQPATREMTDFERFLADAEATERENQAQMWRNLARRSGHYGYSDNPWNSARPVDPSLADAGAANAMAHRNNKRNSAQYTVGKRASMMSYAAAGDERRLTSSNFYGLPTAAHSPSGGDADDKRGLRRQGSVSKRISQYIKPPKPSAEPTYEDWPTGRANRRSVITGAIGE